MNQIKNGTEDAPIVSAPSPSPSKDVHRLDHSTKSYDQVTLSTVNVLLGLSVKMTVNHNDRKAHLEFIRAYIDMRSSPLHPLSFDELPF